jgi:TnpA family transposase
VTPAEIVELARAAAHRARRGPPAGYGRFPEVVSGDELAEYFFFDEQDRRLIARRRRDANRLGFAVQLGTVRYLGRFLEDPSEVPEPVVRFVARRLGVADTRGLSGYARSEARWEHQAEIRRTYGYRELADAGVELELVGWLEARAWVSAESHRALFERTVDHLIAEKVLLPGASVLWRLVGTARERANERGWLMVAGALTPHERERLSGLLAVGGDDRESALERLRRGPVKPNADGVIAALHRLRELRELVPGLTGIEGLPFARVRALMVDARTKRAGDIGKAGELRRLATLAAFVTLGEQQAQDEVVDHLEAVLDEIEQRAEGRDQRQRLAAAPVIDAAGLRLADACTLVLDERIGDPELRRAILAQVGREPLQRAVAQMRQLARPEEGHRERMLASYPTVRAFLPLLLETLDFHATDAGADVLRALCALGSIQRKRALTPADVPLELVPRGWRRLVEPEPGRIDRRAFTFCALDALRDGLHRRDVFVTRSDRWGDPRAILLNDRAWRVSRAETCRSLGLPDNADEFVEQLAGELDDAYARTPEGLRRDHPVFAVAEGRLDLNKLDALPEPESLRSLRARQHAMLPDAELPDLLLEIGARTGFVKAFAHQREPSARLSDLEVSICAVLIAQACNVGWRPVVDESVPALSQERLKWVARHYIRPETLIPANAAIVNYHARLPLAEAWGGGEVASIDGLRFVVPSRTFHARFNRRYFHRRRGVTAIGTTADHYAGIHTIVVPGTQPDALYLLDGLLDPQTSVRPRQIMTDTAGYTDIVFGLFLLLGYRFSPRLADTGGARFWRIDPQADYGRLNPIATNRIDPRLIRDNYDDILRVAGSLLQRATTASDLMRALRSHTRHLATLGRAIAEIGRAPKTVHALDYCNDPLYRRGILGQLNRGEGRHDVARRVCHGRGGQLRQPYRDGQEEQLGALGLVVNCIVLYNTIYTQRILDQLRADGDDASDEDIRRLSPLVVEHINLAGRYHLIVAEELLRGAYRPLKTPGQLDVLSA